VVTLTEAPSLELLGAEQLGEERHGRCGSQGSGFMLLGLMDPVSGWAAAMAECTPRTRSSRARATGARPVGRITVS
jgi:hypothetical protein